MRLSSAQHRYAVLFSSLRAIKQRNQLKSSQIALSSQILNIRFLFSTGASGILYVACGTSMFLAFHSCWFHYHVLYILLSCFHLVSIGLLWLDGW
jgi:hypothetical protein